jgi:hypothetical protein
MKRFLQASVVLITLLALNFGTAGVTPDAGARKNL